MPQPGIEPGPPARQANTLPRRYKSRLVPQGSTSMSYNYNYYILPLHFKIRPRIITWFEQPLDTRPPSLLGHKPIKWGYIYVWRQT